METGDDNCFFSASEVCNSMPYKVSYSNPGSNFRVFQSRHGDELQSMLRSLCPGSSTFTSSNEEIKEKIEKFLQRLGTDVWFFFDGLIQFWSPVRIADKICLTTADQPFAVAGELRKGLFSCRKHCLENSVLINPADGDELSGEQHYLRLSPPEWVFRHGLPEEYCYGNIGNSPVKEYLQPALQLRFKSYAALPLFEYGKQDCVGVLEILSETSYPDLVCFFYRSPKLKKKNVRTGIEFNSDGNIQVYGNRFKYSRKLVAFALPLMQDTSDKHQLPLSQMWFASSDGIHTSRILRVPKEDIDKHDQGVVRQAFLSRNACFSKGCDPYDPFSKQYDCGSFAVCLKSTKGDRFYILEFFFPPLSGMDVDDQIRTSVTKLVQDLKRQIAESKSSLFENLDETLLVDVIGSSVLQNKLYSFEICTTSSSHLVSKHPQGSKMMQHDSLHPHVSGTYDEMRSGTIEKIVPPDVILRPELLNSGDMIEGETHGEVSIEPNALVNEENIVSGVQCERIRVEGNTLDVQYGITREVLQQYQGMKLQDAANKLGVSRSTLKRIRKKYGIKRWHHQGSRKTSSHQDVFNPPNENTDAHSSLKNTGTQDGNSIIVKATYGECIWKFQLLHSAKKIDLEQQLVECLNLPMGSFKIRYLDEENDWISVSRDADLKLCIDTCKSQGKTTIKMLVN